MSATLRPGTLEHYQRDMENHVIPHLGKKMLSQVTAADLRKLYGSLKKTGQVNPHPGQSRGLSCATVHDSHTTLHHALRAAVEQGLVPANPADEAELPKVIRQPMNILNEEQLVAFMETIRADPIWHDFFYTELTTGLRLGKICGLMWADFDGRVGRSTSAALSTGKRAAGCSAPRFTVRVSPIRPPEASTPPSMPH